ncbi:MAG: hypothetical protein ACRCWF_09710 [Beijerinckiaceae bacterium]
MSSLIPSPRTIAHLAAGGIAGLIVWEIFARVVTKAVLGYPLEPAGLIDAIAQHQLGLSINYWLREALHYGVGILGYPIAFYIVSHLIPRWSAVLDAIVLVTFTAGVGLHMSKTGFSMGIAAFWVAVVLLIASRFVNRNAQWVNAISWGTFTWLNALGIMAPIGGLSFYLLGEGGDLSFMSFVGHVIYGAIAVLVFYRLQGKTS